MKHLDLLLIMGIKVTEFGITARGRSELCRHYQGQKLTYKQRCLAMCYDCMGGYTNGKVSCEIKDCPLYPVMPFKNKKKTRSDPENDPWQELNG